MAEVNGENRLTMLELYNYITAQAWSMFDSEVESKDEFEESVTTSMQKALTDLWLSYPFSFREKTKTIRTSAGNSKYNTPIGNILTTTYNNKKVFSVWLNDKPLSYVNNFAGFEEKTGIPEKFYIKQDKMYLYPTPDDSYNISIDYLALYPACNEDGEDKANLEEENDYINISERYFDLFKHALMPLTMWNYLIAAESDENSSAYEIQYKKAYNNLLKYSKGIDLEKQYGWR